MTAYAYKPSITQQVGRLMIYSSKALAFPPNKSTMPYTVDSHRRSTAVAGSPFSLPFNVSI